MRTEEAVENGAQIPGKDKSVGNEKEQSTYLNYLLMLFDRSICGAIYWRQKVEKVEFNLFWSMLIKLKKI